MFEYDAQAPLDIEDLSPPQDRDGVTVYDIAYANLENEPPGSGEWVGPRGSPDDFVLYQSDDGGTPVERSSLVPVVDVSASGSVHVVWQEEDFEEGAENEWYGEILYKSDFSAAVWTDPTAFGANLSNSHGSNSQTPSEQVWF